MLRRRLYPKVEPLIRQCAQLLADSKITPNQLTLAGLALTFLAGWIYAKGGFFLAGIVVLIAGLGDLLDGPLARLTGKTTPFGAFLDSTVDRYSDFFLFGGLAFFYAMEADWVWFVVSWGILLGAFVTSYAKARAEGLNLKCDVGFFERAERVILLALGSLVFPLFPYVLLILLIGTHVTALQRILHVKNAVKKD